MKFVLPYALGAAALLALVPMQDTHAQAGSSRLPTAVITPSRMAQSLDDALPSTTVITRAEIDRWQLSDLATALSREAGVQFAQAGGPGSPASLFLRGANSSQVLVLVDGVQLNAGVGGAAVIGGIALDAIDRIEVTRGNLSSLYGSAAIGGVVQIFTRGAAARSLSLTVEGGQDGHRSATASAGGESGRLRYGAAAGTRRSEQFSSIDAARVIPGPFAPGANPDIDANRNANGSVGAAWRSEGGTVVSGSAWSSRNTTDFDSTADGPTAVQRERSTITAWNARVRTPLTPDWESQLQVGEMRDRSRNSSSAPFSFNNGEFESINRQAAWSNEARVSGQVRAQLGFEYLDQHGASTSFDPSFMDVMTGFDRSVSSAWAGLNGHTDRQLVQLNVRHDRYSDVGSATTGLVSYGYKLTSRWRAVAQVSNAFRAPSFNDLYYPYYGNPDLAPEKSRSGELGLHYAGGPVTARVAAYRTDTRELIVYDTRTQRAENVDRARATGLEAGVGGRSGPWQWSGNVNLVRAVDQASGQTLLRRAPYVVNAALAYDVEQWRAGIEVSRVGARDDVDINTWQRVELGAYTLARLVGSWRVTPAVALRARIENLTDERYEMVSGYNVQPRTAFLGVEIRL